MVCVVSKRKYSANDGLLTFSHSESELRGCKMATTVVVAHEQLLEVNGLHKNIKQMCSTFL